MGAVNESLTSHLKGSAKALCRWGKDLNTKIFRRIGKLKHAFNEKYKKLFPLDFTKINGIETELDKLLEDEEIYSKQRSRENWLKWGDKNTK